MMVHLTIDGQPVEVEEGTTILQAAKKACIHIPTLCYHEDLRHQGGLPHLRGRGRRTETASDWRAAHRFRREWSCRRASPKVLKARRNILELDFCETSAGMPRMSEGRKMRPAEGSAGCRNAPRYPL